MTTQNDHRQIAEEMTPLAIDHVERAEQAYAGGDHQGAAFDLSRAMVFASIAQAHAVLATIPDPVTVPDVSRSSHLVGDEQPGER